MHFALGLLLGELGTVTDLQGVSFLFYKMRLWDQMISNGDQGGLSRGNVWRSMVNDD